MLSTQCRHRNGATSTAIAKQHVQFIIMSHGVCLETRPFRTTWKTFSIIKISSDVDVHVYNTQYNTNLLMNCREAIAKLSGIVKWQFCHFEFYGALDRRAIYDSASHGAHTYMYA